MAKTWIVVFAFGMPLSSWANDATPLIAPVEPPASRDASELKPDWARAIQQALLFTAIQHSFRYATENGTRNPGAPFFPGYASAVQALHGWSDGDPFFVNYIGHPLQGAAASRIWIQNDRKYREVEIGRDPRYWKGRLRGAAFAFVQSAQFELGPMSEASIGSVQKRWPEQGFVDYVVTPTVGFAWVLGEDVLDKYLVKKVERNHRILGILLRSGLNPSASFANALAGKYPWHRQDRTDYPWRTSAQYMDLVKRAEARPEPETPSDVASFEIAAVANVIPDGSGLSCAGGSGVLAIRVTRQLQIAGDIGGCGMSGMEPNLSGDSLHFMAGPRWTPLPASRWSPYVQVLAGGQKITQQRILPEARAALLARIKEKGRTNPTGKEAQEYMVTWADNRWVWKAGAGLDLRLHPAFAIRLGAVDYVSSATRLEDGQRYGHGFQLASGVILRMGTW